MRIALKGRSTPGCHDWEAKGLRHDHGGYFRIQDIAESLNVAGEVVSASLKLSKDSSTLGGKRERDCGRGNIGDRWWEVREMIRRGED